MFKNKYLYIVGATVAVCAGTPREIVNKLHGEIVKTVNDPATRERLLALALDPVGSTPHEFGAYIRSETVKWGKLVREAGIRAN